MILLLSTEQLDIDQPDTSIEEGIKGEKRILNYFSFLLGLLPETHFEQISKIIFIDPTNILSNNNFPTSALTDFARTYLKNKKIEGLLFESKFIQKENDFIELIKVMKTAPAVFYDFTITPIIHGLLYDNENTIGFKLSSVCLNENDDLIYDEIKDVKRYFALYGAFTILETGPQQNYRFDEPSYIELIGYETMRMLRRYINKEIIKICLIGPDKFLSDKLILEIRSKIDGNISIVDCTDNFYDIPETETIIFVNIERLAANRLSHLLTDLDSKAFIDRKIILQAKNEIDLDLYPSFEKVYIPDIIQLKDKITIIIYLIARHYKLVDDNTIEFNYYLHYNTLATITDYIPSFYLLDKAMVRLKFKRGQQLNISLTNFWYDLIDEVNRLNADYNSTTLPKLSNSTNDYRIYPYQFYKRKNNHFRIVFNGKEIALANEDSDGLFYIYMIIKYARNEAYPADILYKSKSKDGQKINDGTKNYSTADYQKSITELKKKQKSLASQAEEMRLSGQDISKIADEILNLDDEIKSLTKKLTYDRMPNQLRDAKKAIDKAIKKVKDECEKNPNFADFFNFLKAIEYNPGTGSYSYRPKDEIPWILEL